MVPTIAATPPMPPTLAGWIRKLGNRPTDAAVRHCYRLAIGFAIRPGGTVGEIDRGAGHDEYSGALLATAISGDRPAAFVKCVSVMLAPAC